MNIGPGVPPELDAAARRYHAAHAAMIAALNEEHDARYALVAALETSERRRAAVDRLDYALTYAGAVPRIVVSRIEGREGQEGGGR